MDCKVGRVQEIHNGSIDVLVERHSACSGCHAKGMCSSADRRDETFTITDFPLGLQVGDRVRIVASKSGNPMKAVLYAFVIPLVLLLIEVVLFSIMGVEENILLVILIASLALYTFILWVFRKFFERKFRLRVEPIE
ncbi:SoxR reducing system RseC family protein [Porphyromonadaceae bacterium W3.11]|nr:SoxR reducing system RseC family protein [Porphyromonadaceae bacterium W3.11]